MNLKEIAVLIQEKKYNEYIDACIEISPRIFTRGYFEKYMETNIDTNSVVMFFEELSKNVTSEQYKKYSDLLSIEAENDYIQRNNLDVQGYFYELTPEEKKQACLI